MDYQSDSNDSDILEVKDLSPSKPPPSVKSKSSDKQERPAEQQHQSPTATRRDNDIIELSTGLASASIQKKEQALEFSSSSDESEVEVIEHNQKKQKLCSPPKKTSTNNIIHQVIEHEMLKAAIPDEMERGGFVLRTVHDLGNQYDIAEDLLSALISPLNAYLRKKDSKSGITPLHQHKKGSTGDYGGNYASRQLGYDSSDEEDEKGHSFGGMMKYQGGGMGGGMKYRGGGMGGGRMTWGEDQEWGMGEDDSEDQVWGVGEDVSY